MSERSSGMAEYFSKSEALKKLREEISKIDALIEEGELNLEEEKTDLLELESDSFLKTTVDTKEIKIRIQDYEKRLEELRTKKAEALKVYDVLYKNLYGKLPN